MTKEEDVAMIHSVTIINNFVIIDTAPKQNKKETVAERMQGRGPVITNTARGFWRREERIEHGG